MVDIIEKLTKRSHKSKNFDKNHFLKKVKYGEPRKEKKQDDMLEETQKEDLKSSSSSKESLEEDSDQIESKIEESPEQKQDEKEDKYAFLKMLPTSKLIELEEQTKANLCHYDYYKKVAPKLSLIESLIEFDKINFEQQNPKSLIDLDKISKMTLSKYSVDINNHLVIEMDYDASTVIAMTMEDRLRIIQINKHDTVLNAREEFDDLTSYETESIKSETEYQIDL